MEGLRGIDDLWQDMEVSRYATEMPVQVSCECGITANPTMTEPWRWTNSCTCSVIDCVAGNQRWIVRKRRGTNYVDFDRCLVQCVFL